MALYDSLWPDLPVYNEGMRIYFSGIGGVGIGPLAEIALDAGYNAVGSDMTPSLVTRELEARGVTVSYDQSGEFLRTEHQKQNIDWFVHTAALTDDHPELVTAHELGIRTSKRDELLAYITEQKQLKLIAVTGTHGKTTTTGMLVWTLKQLGVPVSYSVGTTLSFGSSGAYDPAAEYFVYECDEFDRNFLHFCPHLSIVTALEYDHPDTYPTEDDYRQAFVSFMEQSSQSLIWQKDLRFLKHPDIPATYQAFDEFMDLSHLTLPGAHTRQNAFLVQKAVETLLPDATHESIVGALNSFPGTNRRFEQLAPRLYTDYGHHPAEIQATLQMASELSRNVVLVYQPHQNIRQHEIRHLYTDEIFTGAKEVYWLPTYLSRENAELELLTPAQLTENLHTTPVHVANMDADLWDHIQRHLDDDNLVLSMGAGSIDGWVREQTLIN